MCNVATCFVLLLQPSAIIMTSHEDKFAAFMWTYMIDCDETNEISTFAIKISHFITQVSFTLCVIRKLTMTSTHSDNQWWIVIVVSFAQVLRGHRVCIWRRDVIFQLLSLCVYIYVSRTIFFCAKLSHDFDSGLIRRWVCLFWLLLSRISILQNNVLSCVNNVEVVGIRLWQRLYSVTPEGPVALLERHHIWRLATICRHHHSSDVLSIDFVLQTRNVSSYYTRYDVRRYVQSEASGHVTIPTFCWL